MSPPPELPSVLILSPLRPPSWEASPSHPRRPPGKTADGVFGTALPRGTRDPRRTFPSHTHGCSRRGHAKPLRKGSREDPAASAQVEGRGLGTRVQWPALRC